jgi:hypothetical protein
LLSEIVAEGLICAVTSMYKLCADIIKAWYAHTWRILKRALCLAQKGCVISETSPAILNMTSSSMVYMCQMEPAVRLIRTEIVVAEF